MSRSSNSTLTPWGKENDGCGSGFESLQGKYTGIRCASGQTVVPAGRQGVEFQKQRGRSHGLRVLQRASALPHSKLTCIPQYPLPSAARWGITELLDDLERTVVV